MVGKLTDKQLYQVAKRLTSIETMVDLGVKLGLEDFEIETYRAENPGNITETSFQILNRWRVRQFFEKEPYSKLAEALRDVGLSDIAREVLEIPGENNRSLKVVGVKMVH